jgi:hypothetical protein
MIILINGKEYERRHSLSILRYYHGGTEEN